MKTSHISITYVCMCFSNGLKAQQLKSSHALHISTYLNIATLTPLWLIFSALYEYINNQYYIIIHYIIYEYTIWSKYPDVTSIFTFLSLKIEQWAVV